MHSGLSSSSTATTSVLRRLGSLGWVVVSGGGLLLGLKQPDRRHSDAWLACILFSSLFFSSSLLLVWFSCFLLVAVEFDPTFACLFPRRTSVLVWLLLQCRCRCAHAELSFLVVLVLFPPCLFTVLAEMRQDGFRL